MNFKQRSGFFQRCVATVLAAALFLLPVIALADAGVVTAGYLNLRSAPDEQATVLGSYRSGTRVEVLGSQNGWYKVSVKGKVGYMSARYVSFGSVSGGSQGKTHAVVWSVNGGRVNLRVNPSMDARIITSFPAGQSVEILEKGSYWSRVRVGGFIGYMSTQYLSTGGTNPGSTSKVGVVNNPKAPQVLHLRETPSLNARVLGHYYNGKQVNILGSTGSWYKVRVDGMTGYMLKQYVRVGGSPPVAPVKPVDPFEPIDGASYDAWLKNPNGGTKVNIRALPSTSGAVMMTLPVGTRVTVLGLNASWAKIAIAGGTGYVNRNFLAMSIGMVDPNPPSVTMPPASEATTPYPQPTAAPSPAATELPIDG